MLHSCSSHVANVHANVSKLGLNFSMLQSLIFDVAYAESRCCRHVLLGVANIIFQCCRRCVSMLQTCGVGCCVEEKGEEAPDVGCCTQHGSHHGRNMVATWSQHGEERRKTPDVGCCKQPRSQHFRNTFATRSQHLPGSL
jgi:hypothetical protein